MPSSSLNLKKVDIGFVDRGLKVALSDRHNILGHFPLQTKMFDSDRLPDSEEGVGVRPAKGNWIICDPLHDGP